MNVMLVMKLGNREYCTIHPWGTGVSATLEDSVWQALQDFLGGLGLVLVSLTNQHIKDNNGWTGFVAQCGTGREFRLHARQCETAYLDYNRL